MRSTYLQHQSLLCITKKLKIYIKSVGVITGAEVNSTMEDKCKNCFAAIDTMKQLYTVCEGRCAGKFHASCVGVSEDQLCALSKNIIWICDNCMVDFCKARDAISGSSETHTSAGISITAQLEEMKSQIATISNAIAKLNVSVAPNVSANPHSTPVTSPIPANNASVCTADCTTRPNSRDDFSLLLTNIDRHVTENDIVCLVSESLCAPRPECMMVTKLVPSWKSCEDLDFISFKITLHERWKQSALNANTWPRGLKFREFARRNNCPWKPSAYINATI